MLHFSYLTESTQLWETIITEHNSLIVKMRHKMEKWFDSLHFTILSNGASIQTQVPKAFAHSTTI